MSIILDKYTKLIILSSNNEELKVISDKIDKDPKLSISDKDLLRSIIHSKSNEIEDLDSSYTNASKGTTDNPVYYNHNNIDINYGEYYVDDLDYLESCTSLWEKGDYLSFMENEFFSRFVYVPYLEEQKKLLLTLLFVNSKACGKKIPLPHFYFLSRQPNSGKSTFAKFIANHYTKGSYVYIAEDTPGGTLRQIFNDANQHNNPTYCLLDNFHPQKTVERLGSFYGRLLKYTYEESQCSVSQGIGKELLEFNTFGLKVFTSIFPLDKKTEELKSRCFTILFETSPITLEDIDNYDWSPLQYEYYKIWGDTVKSSQQIRSIMNKLNHKHKSERLNNRRWQLTKYLIAVGVMVGIHKGIDEAIQYYESYFDWYDSLEISSSKNSLQLALEEYVNFTHPKRVSKEIQIYGDEAFLKYNEIYYNDLFTYLSKIVPISRNMSTENQITSYLSQHGWKMELVKDMKGDKINIIYRLPERNQ